MLILHLAGFLWISWLFIRLVRIVHLRILSLCFFVMDTDDTYIFLITWLDCFDSWISFVQILFLWMARTISAELQMQDRARSITSDKGLFVNDGRIHTTTRASELPKCWWKEHSKSFKKFSVIRHQTNNTALFNIWFRIMYIHYV